MSVPARFISSVALTTALALGVGGLSACSSSDDGAGVGVTLTFGFQTADYPALLEASGLFEDLPYKLETPVISGPAQQISALYSKATDFGLVGENTAAFEAANADNDLSSADPKIYTIAGLAYRGTPYPSPTLYAKKSANISKIEDLKGHSVAYNFGGNIYAGYVKILADAGLTVDDIEPVQLPDNQAAAAAFAAGQVDAVVTSYSQVAKAIESGEAVEVINNEEFGVTGGAGFITRPDVLADPEKLAAAKDFFGRFSKLWSEWYPAHEAEATGILQDVLKQSPEIAKINFDNNKYARLYRVGDPQFIADQQGIVKAAFAAGGVKHDYDVTKVFNPVFDDVTVPNQ